MRYLLGFLFFMNISPLLAGELKIEDKALYQVTLARTRDELSRGLMFVRDLPEDQGMIFDFRAYQDRELHMWMKNTYIPLDMLFIDCSWRVVDFYENAEPLSLKPIGSAEKFCYVLELNGGSVNAKNIMVGDRVIYSDI